MKLLGICGGFHDACACVMVDGRIVALAEEERFTRRKHAPDQWPTAAADWCLARAGLKDHELDGVAYYHDLDLLLRESPKLDVYQRAFAAHPEKRKAFEGYFRGKQSQLQRWCKERALPEPTVIRHHDTHLASAFFGSRFDEAAVLSLDARGETVSTVMAVGRGAKIEKLHEIALPHSLGLLYTMVTGHLGYSMFDGEGTVMGLAPYGEDRYRAEFDRIIRPTPDGFECDPAYTLNDFIDAFTADSNGLTRRWGPPRPYRQDPRNGTDEHLAASLQAATTRILIHLARLLHVRTGLRKFCLAGGVALNAKANGELWQQDFVDDLYIQPLANDAGCAVGGAMALHNRLTGERPEPMGRIDLGPDWTDAQIEAELVRSKLKFSRPANLAGAAADLLQWDGVVGWFQGRMEAGPRALGHRSILADPRRRETADTVNNRVKFREPWRPFAASILHEAMDEFFERPSESPFMIICHPVRPEAQQRIAAAVHVDGTTRPQRVRRECEPLYHELISAFAQRTGVPALLNTSFNLKGQPIVNTPAEAIEMFQKTQMDALAIGPFLAKK